MSRTMDVEVLQDLLGIEKIPSHPNKSTYGEWLDLYERYSQTPAVFFPSEEKDLLIEEFRAQLSDRTLDDQKFYALKMFIRDLDEIVITRRSVKNKRKNSVLSRIAKQRWRRNRHKYKRALNKFHRSTKGKDFHKSLGRFLRKSIKKSEAREPWSVVSDQEISNMMLAINSALTHILIEYDRKNKADANQNFEVYSYDFLEHMILITNQMLLELNLALKLPPEDRWELVHDVIFLSGEVLIPSGVETEYEYHDQ